MPFTTILPCSGESCALEKLDTRQVILSNGSIRKRSLAQADGSLEKETANALPPPPLVDRQVLDLRDVETQSVDTDCPDDQLTVGLYHVVSLAVEDVDGVSSSSQPIICVQ